MQIRAYQPSDIQEIAKLFYDTVHTVNARDYTEEQVDAWANGQPDLDQWNRSFLDHYSLVAVDQEKIVGFGDLDVFSRYLDRLYVHKDHQGEGIGTALCSQLEAAAAGSVTTHASITARPFFEKRGYRVIRKQQVERQGVFLTNYVMEQEKA